MIELPEPDLASLELKEPRNRPRKAGEVREAFGTFVTGGWVTGREALRRESRALDEPGTRSRLGARFRLVFKDRLEREGNLGLVRGLTPVHRRLRPSRCRRIGIGCGGLGAALA